jgi:hypothetical protein
MENYDVPGSNQRIEAASNWKEEPPIGVSVNGEGKMPLVTGSIPLKLPNSQAIYAQVDKSKKTPRTPLCDLTSVPQPLYVNTEGQPKGQAPQSYQPQNNYVNLEFMTSLDLYENAKGVGPPPAPNIQQKQTPAVEKTPSRTEVAATEKMKDTNEKREADDGPPLRRSSSVPCKGGHANRGSASSSDSGVSGDGGLFFEDGTSLNELRR